jgi:hypothetical protein
LSLLVLVLLVLLLLLLRLSLLDPLELLTEVSALALTLALE